MKTRFFFVASAALLLAVTTAFAASVPVSVTNVTITPNPVLRANDTGTVTVRAAISATFDQGSDVTTLGNCKTVRSGSTITGYTRTDTEKVVTIASTLSAVASDGTNTANVAISGTTGKATLSRGLEGSTSVTVTASASETTTTQINSIENSWPAVNGGCTGTQNTGFPIPTPGTPSSTTSTGSANGNGTYLVDIAPPSLTIFNDAPASVHQGGHEMIHTKIAGGSSDTLYTLTDFGTGPCTVDGTTGAVDCSSATAQFSATDIDDKFNHSQDGIASDRNDVLGVKIACDAPLGTYQVSSKLDSVDLGGNAWPQAAQTGGTFVVTPGISLSAQTSVLSELPPDSQYGTLQCFTDSLNRKTGKLTNNPGTVHIAATLNTTGPCAGFGTYYADSIVLTLPAGFSFANTGGSPTAHVFIGVGSFDAHSGVPFTEVTSLVTQAPGTDSTTGGATDTINLSQLDAHLTDSNGNPLPPGVIPSNYTIYARAHALYTGPGQSSKNAGYVFSVSASGSADGNSLTTGLSDATSVTITGNPTSSCVNGNFQ